MTRARPNSDALCARKHVPPGALRARSHVMIRILILNYCRPLGFKLNNFWQHVRKSKGARRLNSLFLFRSAES